MQVKWAILILGMLLHWPTAIGAEFVDGNALHSICTGSDGPGTNTCRGYLTGVADAMTAYNARNKSRHDSSPNSSCIPEGVSAEQLRQVWVKYSTETPENLHLAAAGLVIVAFEQAWPCPR